MSEAKARHRALIWSAAELLLAFRLTTWTVYPYGPYETLARAAPAFPWETLLLPALFLGWAGLTVGSLFWRPLIHAVFVSELGAFFVLFVWTGAFRAPLAYLLWGLLLIPVLRYYIGRSRADKDAATPENGS